MDAPNLAEAGIFRAITLGMPRAIRGRRRWHRPSRHCAHGPQAMLANEMNGVKLMPAKSIGYAIAMVALVGSSGCTGPDGLGTKGAPAESGVADHYTETILASGPGWSKLRISGYALDSGGQYFDGNVYVLRNAAGIATSPLDDGVKSELELEAGGVDGDVVYSVSEDTIKEIMASEKAGALSPALQAIAEPGDVDSDARGGAKLFGKCSSKSTTMTKAVDLSAVLTSTHEFGSGFTGTLALDGNVEGSATVEIKVERKRYAIFGACIPYAIRFEHARAYGNAVVGPSLSLTGTLTYKPKPWETEIAKPSLGALTFMVGPVPVRIPLSLPVSVGFDLEASATGTLVYNTGQTASGNFDYQCTLNECSGTGSYSFSGSSQTPTVTASAEGRVKPAVWAQVAVRAALYDEKLAYAQAGVRPYVYGDLWGYYGNNCGDANEDGENETVDALTFDLDWQVRITGEAAAFGGTPKRWKLWQSKRNHIAFWDLAGSKAIEPMLSGPATASTGASSQYGAKMRPCWPYEDSVNYALAWGNDTTAYFSGPAQTWTNVTGAWGNVGSYTMNLTALSDEHGRNFNGTTARTVHIGQSSENLALGASTSASSTFCSGSDVHCYHPERINDGDPSTALGGYTSWSNDYGNSLPQWVELNFGSAHSFARVELYTTMGYEVQNYELQYWNGSAWLPLVTVSGNTEAHRTHTFQSVSASKLRVMGLLGSVVQPGYVRLNEVEVYEN
ncbi:discoidin domain-containing protein [Polyangium sp. 15x6]|uniref:discoidin domain-containing protein n=1 Tax=Polyangium sp. 15x6 TaxID=3042687 RepID=UPI00249BF265|nr:discoidin domain-containing protein [Polyangium sp. 15x6]MDI3287348.1 discoidin domain-containing protein [Polyangium sp. 15x6]